MFSYYGSKSKVVHLYPAPKYPKIIEPFAGSARYALKWWDRDVLLVDKYEVIVKIWHYLQQASSRDILGLPKLIQGMKLDTLNLSDDEKLFLGFLAAKSSLSPRNTVSYFASYENGNQNQIKYISDQINKIKHWIIKLGSFEDIPNQEATWFIDPPYQIGGQAYIENHIDFIYLANWSQSRQGQVIVCENTKADWLPFWPLKKIQGSANTNTTEAIWCNDIFQPKLFS